MKIYLNTLDTGGYSKGIRGSKKMGTLMMMIKVGAYNFHNVFRYDRWEPKIFSDLLQDPFSFFGHLENKKKHKKGRLDNAIERGILLEIADGKCQLTSKKVNYKDNGQPLLEMAHIFPEAKAKEYSERHRKMFNSPLFLVLLAPDVHKELDNRVEYFNENITKLVKIGKKNYKIAVERYDYPPFSSEEMEEVECYLGMLAYNRPN